MYRSRINRLVSRRQEHLFRCMLLAVALALLPAPWRLSQVQAQSYDVCVNGCRYNAIQAAINAAAPGATVSVAPGVYRETLRLKADVRVVGAGIEQTILQGDSSQTMVVASGAQIQRPTLLEGMTIAGGGASGGAGPGGMLIDNAAAPTIRNLRLRDNTSHGSSGGGLMVANGADALLERVEFRNNRASAGAALNLWDARATLRDCVIVDNVSQGPNGAVYGAVYLDEGSELTMTGTVISGTATASGGGMAVVGSSKATITDSRFQNNQARSQGGAILVRSGSMLILNRVVLAENTSLLDGGAVTVSQAAAEITGSTFTGNSAQQDAGALNVILNSDLLLRDSTVENNRAERFAGGITIQNGSQALIEHSLVRNNLVTANHPHPQAGVAGGIKVYGPDTVATIRYNRIEGNTAKDGGAIYVEFQASAEMSSNEIVANHAIEYGGGIVINDDAWAQIVSNVITGNRSRVDGGGLWIHNGSSAHVEGNLIAANQAIRHGGGLTIFEDVHTVVLDNLITGNIAGQDGGGVRLTAASASLTYNRIRNNHAGGDGGAVMIQSAGSGVTELRNNLLEDNRAQGAGAGVFMRSTSPTLINNSIVNNGRGQSGAGLHLSTGAAPTLTNNIIVRNDYGIRSSGGAPVSSARNDVYDNQSGNYSGVTAGATDLSVDPLFVNGFYLSHIAAGQGVNSPLVDAGQGTASSIGLHNRTTRTDGVPDQGVVDLGYHYPLPVRLDINRPTMFFPLLILGN